MIIAPHQPPRSRNDAASSSSDDEDRGTLRRRRRAACRSGSAASAASAASVRVSRMAATLRNSAATVAALCARCSTFAASIRAMICSSSGGTVGVQPAQHEPSRTLPAGEHLEHHGAQRIDVAARICRFAGELFGSDVRRARVSIAADAATGCKARQPEVHELRAIFRRNHDGVGPDVAVNQVGGMSLGQRVGEVDAELERPADVQRRPLINDASGCPCTNSNTRYGRFASCPISNSIAMFGCDSVISRRDVSSNASRNASCVRA